MKLNLLTAALLTFFVTFPQAIQAEQTLNYIVIAADQSGSMYHDGGLALQNEAIGSAIDEYVEQCGEVLVVYLPWGSKPFSPVSFMLSTLEDREKFLYDLQHDFGWENLSGTNHGPAIRRALAEIEAIGAIEAVLLFTTDELGDPVNTHIPEGVTLFKLSIGDPAVKSYLQNDFLPEQGFSLHANTATELQSIVKDVFSIAAPDCLG